MECIWTYISKCVTDICPYHTYLPLCIPPAINLVASTYESVMMKHYKRGRTETGRTMTPEAKHFVQVMK